MHLHAGPPEDMMDSSLAGSRDELLLHFCPFHCSFFCVRWLLKERKKRFTGRGTDDGNAGTSAPVDDRLSRSPRPWAARTSCEPKL